MALVPKRIARVQAERSEVMRQTFRVDGEPGQEGSADLSSDGKLAQAQRAWQVLAEKVVCLADRNADLEQVHVERLH